jgi:hypothetical protein
MVPWLAHQHLETYLYKFCTYDFQAMSEYTKIICPYTMRSARYKKYRPDALTPPSGSYSPSLLLGTGMSTYWDKVSK